MNNVSPRLHRVKINAFPTPYESLSWDQKLGLHIQLQRRFVGLTQKAFCEKVSMTRQQISDREYGIVQITALELERFASVLNCSAESLKPKEEV